MKKALKITGDIFQYVLFILLLTAVFTMAYCRTHPQKTMELYGYKFMPVLSGSMEPVLKAGDLAIVKHIAANEIEQGDIITYKDGEKDRYITHRVIKVENTGGKIQFITKGDANDASDTIPVGQSQLSGKYIFRIPYGGYISSFVETLRGYILLVLLPIATLMVFEIITILSEMKKIKAKNQMSGNEMRQ